MSPIAAPVAGQRKVGEQEVNRGEASIQIVVEVCNARIESISNFLALKSPGCGEDCDLREGLEGMETAPAISTAGLEDREGRARVEVVVELLDDEGNVGLEVIDRQADFDESLLLHEDVVGYVVGDSLAKNRCCEVLCTNMSEIDDNEALEHTV